MKRTLLIDGDILCYGAAAAVETRIRWDEDCHTREPGSVEDARAHLVRSIEDLRERFKGDEIIVCLSCPTVEGWRIKLLPTYKAHRNPSAKPFLLEEMKQHCRDTWPTYERPTLEADDVLGILSTHPTLVPGKKLVVSIDKDLQTIPGWLFNPQKDSKPRYVDEAEADLWHMYQTLVGDSTDGYRGCPGIGKVKAGRILHDEEGETSLPELWRRVVATYEAKGLTEEDALLQARVARICRASDYDFKRKEVILWQLPSAETSSTTQQLELAS